MGRYRVFGRTMEPGDAGFDDALRAAHAQHHRPACLCTPAAPPMYVARLGRACVLKRMPGTGAEHATDCPSYDPPGSLAGPHKPATSAVEEDPRTGVTTLHVGFALRQAPAVVDDARPLRAPRPRRPADHPAYPRLTLPALLRYLWHEAGLTRWHPGFAGRRHWRTVRRHLLQAAAQKVAGGAPLAQRLYVPEAFRVGQREALDARRREHWAAIRSQAGDRALMVLIAELKALQPAGPACRATVKHLPDAPFLLDPSLYRWTERSFRTELSLWTGRAAPRLILIATVSLDSPTPTVTALALMPVTAEWLPVYGRHEARLLAGLVDAGRAFFGHVDPLRHAPGARTVATLTDAGPAPIPLQIADGAPDTSPAPGPEDIPDREGSDAWMWYPQFGPMPPLPNTTKRKTSGRSPRARSSPDEQQLAAQLARWGHIGAIGAWWELRYQPGHRP